MNEAQFLLSLGMVPVPTREGLCAPYIVNARIFNREVWDAELGGTVIIPGTTFPRPPKESK